MHHNLKPRNITNRFFAILGCILLLLSSCTVRDAISGLINIESAKPVSPAKTASTQASSCNIFGDSNSFSEKTYKVVVCKLKLPAVGYFFHHGQVLSTGDISRLHFKFVHKLPKYILFKKIKYLIF